MKGRGYSLVELLVALGLAALLALGLLRFLAGSLQALERVQASLSAQRSLRRGLDELADEVREAGFRVPFPGAGSQRPPLTVVRNQPVKGTELRADELTLVADGVLPGGGSLAEPLAPGRPAQVALTAVHRTRLEAGDVVLVEDGHWEALAVTGPVDLVPGRVGVVDVTGLGEPGSHGSGAPVTFLRPGRHVTYALALDRKASGPALVRLESPGSRRVVAPNVSAFRVEEVPATPLVRLTLEASGGRGLSRDRTVLLRVRNQP
jgi:prepilin-type N-terminal cleavage/methylation domain-containing protein